MTGFSSMNGIDVKSAYSASFGNLGDGTCYVDTLGSYNRVGVKSDLRDNFSNVVKANLKALNTDTGAGSTDKVMIPIYVDPKVVDLTRKQTPLVDVMPRVSNLGRTADFNQISAKGGAFFAAEDASLTETDTTFVRQSVLIKYLYAVGRTTGQAQAAQPGYNLMGYQPTAGEFPGIGSFSDQSAPNANQLNVLIKARELRELEENAIINGDTGSDPNEFDGIVVTLGTTNALDKTATALDLDDVNKQIEEAYKDGGLPNLAVCDSATFVKLQSLLNEKIGFLQSSVRTEFGFTSITLNTMVGQLQVIPSRFLSSTAGSQSMYFLDLSVWEMRVLQDMTFERLAKTNDSEKFMIKMYEALICRANQFNASIINMTN